jgi:hypothetical protein
MMLAAGCLVLPAGPASAQQAPEGIVQLGHGAGTDCLTSDCCDGAGIGGDRHGRNDRDGVLGGGRLAARRHARRGDYGPYSAARIHGGRHGFGGNPHYGPCKLGHWLNCHSPYHRCTVPPDHGFAPPAHRPICPTAAAYGRMFGGPGGAAVDPNYRHPMVYMPTDTTQLGFYYQHVPYWTPRPGMIPPVPHPDEWHTPDTGVVFTGFEDAASYYGLHEGPAGDYAGHGPLPAYEPGPDYVVPGDAGEAPPVPLHESNPPYSPEPLNPQLVPPAPAAEDELAPLPPGAPVQGGQDLGKSASRPQLIPVPRQ